MIISFHILTSSPFIPFLIRRYEFMQLGKCLQVDLETNIIILFYNI
jgi:hypothetical protein